MAGNLKVLASFLGFGCPTRLEDAYQHQEREVYTLSLSLSFLLKLRNLYSLLYSRNGGGGGGGERDGQTATMEAHSATNWWW